MSAPAAATWLLKKFRPGDEALLADLLEESPNGRSTAWYWRQVIDAIVAGVLKDIRDHPLLALRAIATGWIVLLLIFALLGDRTAEAIAEYGWSWSRYRDGFILVPLVILLTGLFSCRTTPDLSPTRLR